MRRKPGVTRWQKWSWTASAVLPGASDACWKLLRDKGDSADFHAATLSLTLYQSDTEAYAHELGAEQPSVYVVLRADPDMPPAYLSVDYVTASPYEAQDYCDSGEEIVEKVPMTEGLLGWIGAYVQAHHTEERFVKRKRRPALQDRVDDRPVIRDDDVYRVPTAKRHEAAE